MQLCWAENCEEPVSWMDVSCEEHSTMTDEERNAAYMKAAAQMGLTKLLIEEEA
jgi:hypothetical protein